ncbi:MAG TPA: tetratricopeptide repeat protein [Dehalococcoidia bacterium]
MAAQGKSLAIQRLPLALNAYWLAAGLAAALSLAAALFTVFGGAASTSGPPAPFAAQQAQALNDRIAFFETHLAGDPNDVVALDELAGDYYQRARQTGDLADYNRADTASSRAVAILPGYFNSVVAAALTKNALHDFQGSLSLAQHAVDLRPGQGSGYALRGDDYVALGRYEDAARDYQKAVELEPGLSAFSRLATISFLRGDVRNAEDFWKQAISSLDGLPAENAAYVRTQLAQLYFDRADLDKAESQVDQALKAYPDYVHAVAARARIEASRGKFDTAIADYTSVVQRQPLVEYVIALGETYEAAGRSAEAEQEYALVDAIDKLYKANGINTDLALSVFYANHDRTPDKGLALAQSAYKAAPSIYAADAYAWALYKNGRAADAAPLIDEAMRLGTPDASLFYHAGLIQKALGNDNEAAALLAKALKTNPNFSLIQAPIARQALSDLRSSGKAVR